MASQNPKPPATVEKPEPSDELKAAAHATALLILDAYEELRDTDKKAA